MCLVTTSSPVAPTTTPHDGGLRKRVASTVSTARTASTVSSSTEASTQQQEEEDVVDIVASFEQVDSSKVLHYFLTSGVLLDFFHPRKPWVLVKDGSCMGNFDWVPRKFRVGPWHWSCVVYLVVLTVFVTRECTTGWKEDPFPTSLQPMTAFTPSWYYNTAAFVWTLYQCVTIWNSGMGWTSWGMYTIWSWTFTTVRHGLCAAAPLLDSPTITLHVAEQLRFPMLVQATLTFGVWNAVIGPSIYRQMKTPATKQSFCRFFGNSLWRQMHVYNILWAALGGIWGSPGRSLTRSDFATALAICLVYAYFYVVCLDRLGVHYYLVFSPRTPFALVSWTFAFGCYYACFPLWKTLIDKYAY